ncbi:hypothetical protein VTO73DRAFT_4393 [Trametes versicolor]
MDDENVLSLWCRHLRAQGLPHSSSRSPQWFVLSTHSSHQVGTSSKENALSFVELELASQFPPPAVARALEEYVLAVLQLSALRAVRRLREESLPEQSQRRVVEDGATEARHVCFGVSVRLQCRTGQMVRRIERLVPQEVVAGVRPRSSVFISPIRLELDGKLVLRVRKRTLVALQWRLFWRINQVVTDYPYPISSGSARRSITNVRLGRSHKAAKHSGRDSTVRQSPLSS